MWRELILEAADDAELGQPAGEDALAAVESVLGQPLPAELASLLRECDGVRGRNGVDVVWNAERIALDNAEFRAAPDFAALYMPFEPLMFFGDNAGGDQLAFVRTPPRTEVFVWDHETDSRRLACYRLAQYLGRALRETGDRYR
ncbi:SMI1/KNR4 family protein [Streptomyces sp. NRRL B-24484]|uniref:SMI1/KNR4 family protein n=1 Tax=Streptomyces sp. NRRL B-24484 TaxID=1463833 RepID=UPI0004C02A18|nr:SMI1/KNR4 family protein [Streptomyces sp. NRRL B-24484]